MDMLKESGRKESGFKLEERPVWYQVNHFLLELAQSQSALHINPAEMVHLGGTGNFYRLYQIYGSRAVMHFRGTHDMDIINFRPGNIQRVVEKMVRDYEDETGRDRDEMGRPRPKPRLHRVSGFGERRESTSLPDKFSTYVTLDYRDNPGIAKRYSGFEIDIYETNTGRIKFNDRVFTQDKVILDPPEVLHIMSPGGKGREGVAVTSLRDYFIIKMDIVDLSRQGLRTKDILDVLTLVKICDDSGKSFEGLLEDLVSPEVNSVHSAKKKIGQLSQVFEFPWLNLSEVPEDYPFMPSRSRVLDLLRLIRSHDATLRGRL